MREDILNIQQTIAPYIAAVEQELRDFLTLGDEPVAPMYGMFHYHLGWVDENFQPTVGATGKRLRPVFCLLTCEALGDNYTTALPAAAALELIHNFSLIHDDIEDKDEVRRHRPTVWKVWGIPFAINAGDGMFALAHLCLQRSADYGASGARTLAACRVFDAACLTLVEGQHLDLSFEARLDVSLDEYLHMIHHKTANLLATSTQLGALLATDDVEIIAHYRQFGESIGMAFQVMDDILGIWGDAAVLGKPIGSDIRKKKKSLPIVYALNNAAGRDAELLREIYQKSALSDMEVQTVIEILDNIETRVYAEQLVSKYHAKALNALAATPGENRAKEILRSLAEFLSSRTH